MPKLAANLSWIYQEVPFLQRFGAAAAHGFKAVEILFPYEAPAADIAAELKKHKLTQALCNLPPGDASRTLHIMSGMIAAGADVKAMHKTFISNLKMACDRTAKSGLTLVLEPINHRDIPGYFTNTTGQVEQVIQEVGAPHLKLQLDLYHMQVTEGDLTKRTERLFPITAHVQIAGNPDRNEPDIGETNHLYLLDVLDRLGYQGYVGLEYKPKTTTGAGLGWAAKYGIKA
jgi:hydroxypyruvate isomerase